ncbi:hypothetical protein DRJ22_02605 [Candidatus Woesearchaeota archaeon]|nr:MAG: hypothetical protein DRJ22_02605 [Candidatus Woesearchaeota archaeon]
MRIQSPSSIKIYKQCPRKYYYTYIEELERPSNIHQVRGRIAHSVLEKFFDINAEKIELKDFETQLKIIIQKLLLEEWTKNKEELNTLKLSEKEQIHYFEDTMMMLLKWTEQFCQKIKQKKGSFQERFTKLTPIREQLYESESYKARGYIDAIEKDENGTIRIMDYKTNGKIDINDHILQLSIYALLYYEKHKKLPEYVGIYFLRKGEEIIEVNMDMLEKAKEEIRKIHENTKTNNKKDYPKKPGPLCKWSTGQCEFYDICKPFEKED